MADAATLLPADLDGWARVLPVARQWLVVEQQEGHQRRILEVQYKSAWFLSHRIRPAMRSGDLSPFGSDGGIVEVDETFLGRIKGAPKKRAFHHKMKVLALVDRDSGKCRTMVDDNVTAATLMPIVRANVAKEATIMTDEHNAYARTVTYVTVIRGFRSAR